MTNTGLHMNKQETFVTDALSDHEIVNRILRGEKDLYALIVRRYNQRHYRVGMSIIKDEAEVEDVMQVTYIKAYENLEQFSFKAGFSTWITRILINQSLLRLKKRGRSINLNDDMMNNAICHQQAATVQTPAASLINSELKAVLAKAICQLPDIYRTVFIMREIENMNVAETQACLDISEVNVKVRLNRARTMLKDSLSAFYRKEDILHFYLPRCNRMTERVMQQIDLTVPDSNRLP